MTVQRLGVLAVFLLGLFAALLLTAVQEQRDFVSDMPMTADEAALFAEDDAESFGEEPLEVSSSSAAEHLLAIREGKGGHSEALIASGGSARYYLRGERLSGSSSEVVQILDNAVLLRRGQVYELLCCALESFDSSGESVAPGILDLRAQPATTLRARSYHTRLYQNPFSLIGAVEIETVERGGNRHYRVFPGSDFKAFVDFGLQAGDIILGVNGIDLAEKKAIPKLFGALASASHIAVTLLREGQEMVVLLALDDSSHKTELVKKTLL